MQADTMSAFHIYLDVPIEDKRPLSHYLLENLDVQTISYLSKSPKEKNMYTSAVVIVSSPRNILLLNSNPKFLNSIPVQVVRITLEEADELVESKRTKLYVGNIPHPVDTSGLWKHFVQYGQLSYTYIVKRPSRNGQKGFGYVIFLDRDSILKALKAKHYLNGVKLNCKLFEKKGKAATSIPDKLGDQDPDLQHQDLQEVEKEQIHTHLYETKVEEPRKNGKLNESKQLALDHTETSNQTALDSVKYPELELYNSSRQRAGENQLLPNHSNFKPHPEAQRENYTDYRKPVLIQSSVSEAISPIERNPIKAEVDLLTREAKKKKICKCPGCPIRLEFGTCDTCECCADEGLETQPQSQSVSDEPTVQAGRADRKDKCDAVGCSKKMCKCVIKKRSQATSNSNHEAGTLVGGATLGQYFQKIRDKNNTLQTSSYSPF
jgi:RNA recognition motif-containing protein